MTVLISSLDQALDLIDKGEVDWKTVDVDSGLCACRIKIHGDGYDSSISGTFIKGLAAFQDSVYRTYAVAKYGEANLTRLTDEERQQLTIWVLIKPGCTDILAQAKGLIEALKGLTKDMGPMQKTFLLVALAAIISGTWYWISDSNNETKVRLAEIVSRDHQQALEVIQNVILKEEGFVQTLNQAASGYAEAEKQLIKNAGNIRQIEVGSRSYDQSDIREIQKTSEPKTRGRWMPIQTVRVAILGVDRSTTGSVVLEVKELPNGEQYRMVWSLLDPDSDPLLLGSLREEDESDLRKICNALATQEVIEIDVTKFVRNSVAERVKCLGVHSFDDQ